MNGSPCSGDWGSLVNITPVNLSHHGLKRFVIYIYPDSFKNELKAARILQRNQEKGIVNLGYKTKSEFKKCHLPWNHFYISWDGYK